MRNTQPVETFGKVVKYMCNGKWHHPFFADQLNWASDGLITEHGVITRYEIVNCSSYYLAKLKNDLAVILGRELV